MRANKASLQEFQLVNCTETHGRSGGSPESKSCLGRLLVESILGKVNSIIHPVPLRRNSNKTHMNLNCQPEIKLLSSNWLPGILLLLLWPKNLLLGIGSGVGYKLSIMELVKKSLNIELE